MADGADVRSIDAVRDWHAALVDYRDGLSDSLAGVELEIRRARDWLEEQLSRWQRAIRDCEEEVVRAKAELAQRKFPTWDGREPDCTVQEKALRLAKARLEHSEDQVAKCRQWLGRLPKMVDELYVGASRRLSNFIDAELPKALVDLSRRVESLESYAGLRTDYAPAPMLSALPANSSSSPQPEAEQAANATKTSANELGGKTTPPPQSTSGAAQEQ
jgi:hypothetical protein